jgi:hypothetical protein
MRSALADAPGRRRIVSGWLADSSGPGWRRILNAAGDYTILFDRPFAGKPNARAIVENAGTNMFAKTVASDRYSVRFNLVTLAGTLADSGGYFEISGVDW